VSCGVLIHRDMTPRRRTAKLLCGGDLHTFALVMALVIFLPFSVVVKFPTASPHGNWGNFPRIRHAMVLGAWAWGANRDDAMIVTVTRDGRVYFRTDEISSSQLPARIRECLNSGSERRIYLRADARVRHGYVKPVLEAVQSSGVGDVSIFASD
jgi:biopolymer transport protein ExbD